MDERLKKYVESVFAPYEDSTAARELKEELLNDLQERLNDLLSQGHDEETAYRMTIDSIGDISETIEGVTARVREERQSKQKDYSRINLKDSDFMGVVVHDGKFNASNLRGSDFSGSDLTKSSFRYSDL